MHCMKSAARKAIESTYDGVCSVVEYQAKKKPNTKITTHEEVTVLEYEPCRLSFEKLNAAVQTENAAAISLGAKLFIAPEVKINMRVLDDINSMTTVSDTLGEDFKSNQTIRVLDQIANDIAVLFNTKYLGTVANDEAGRISLWSDIVKHHQQLAEIRAIENFSDSDIVVSQGEAKKSVVVSDAVTIINAMSKLYMTVTVL